LCGFYGVDARFRVHGTVVDRAIDAAVIAARLKVAVVVTQSVFADVSQQFMGRPLAASPALVSLPRSTDPQGPLAPLYELLAEHTSARRTRPPLGKTGSS